MMTDEKYDNKVRVMRVTLLRAGAGALYVRCPDRPDEMAVSYASPVSPQAHEYLRDIAEEGLRLNLIDAEYYEDDSRWHARLIVADPDILLDISSLAACFTSYGHHPYVWLCRRLSQRANSQPILLGSFSGEALDSLIHDENATMGDILKRNFQDQALGYSSCPGFNAQQYKADAAVQTENIRRVAKALFADGGQGHALLEPSFVSEQLGLQGRVDLMTDDFRLLVEQKSGRNYHLEPRYRSSSPQPVEGHYVQLLLYDAVLRTNFGRTGEDTRLCMLYSKYPMPGDFGASPLQGLLDVTRNETLLEEAMTLRNRIVLLERRIARDGFASVFADFTVETLLAGIPMTKFVRDYQLPGLHGLLDPLHALNPLEKSYFCRMMTFLFREQQRAQAGVGSGKDRSMAAAWRMSPEEKRDAGNIYAGLKIKEKRRSEESGGYDTIVLAVGETGDDFLPDFRRGDMVCLYAYPEGEVPDMRRSILFRGVLTEILPDRITVVLNDAQRSGEALRGTCFAVEHAGSDALFTASMRGLYTMMTAPQSRRDLLLGQTRPRRDESISLKYEYDDGDKALLTKALQARDYFLLSGPPGTGKTSRALQYLVREELARPGARLLLTAYTHRAVDEICDMLETAGFDYLRLGNEYAADEKFRPRLIQKSIRDLHRLDDIKEKILSTRIFVSTVATLLSRPFLFDLCHFSTLITDEAGQILETNLAGLLAMQRKDECCIDKFILIGDYKQLPAVVAQPAEETGISDECLKEIGMTDCRMSLFQRLMQQERRATGEDWGPFMGVLHRQGRMHPGIATFPSTRFYTTEGLTEVPCPHQLEQELYPGVTPEDDTDRLLLSRRVLFFPSPKVEEKGISDKVNRGEAQLTADLIRRIRRFYGEQFDSARTVGVIVPYRNQISMIRKYLARLGDDLLMQVSVDTVERFQGSQRDVIIYSFTVNHPAQLDFLTEGCITENGVTIDRKLNVAITRARRQLLLTGYRPLLIQNPVFRDLIEEVTNVERGASSVEREYL